MEAPAVTAQQLHEWYGPLHVRCPETRVEGLERGPDGEWRLSRHGMLSSSVVTGPLPAWIAADLLVMEATRDVQSVEMRRMADDRFCAVIRTTIDLNGPRGVGYGGTRAEAVATARHRAKDAEEAK